jgi:hypothetical protein
MPQTALSSLYEYTGTETTVTLGAGTYDITAYGAQGGSGFNGGGGGSLEAEMGAQFNFTGVTTLTLLVGGSGSAAIASGGGGGGSFVIIGSTPLVVAGGGGGGGYDYNGGSGLTGTGGGGGGGLAPGGGGNGNGGAGGNGNGGGYGYFGGGGGSIIDASGTVLTEISGIASPDDSPNGEIIISDVSPVPEPTTLISGALLLLPFGSSAVRQLRKKLQAA